MELKGNTVCCFRSCGCLVSYLCAFFLHLGAFNAYIQETQHSSVAVMLVNVVAISNGCGKYGYNQVTHSASVIGVVRNGTWVSTGLRGQR